MRLLDSAFDIYDWWWWRSTGAKWFTLVRVVRIWQAVSSVIFCMITAYLDRLRKRCSSTRTWCKLHWTLATGYMDLWYEPIELVYFRAIRFKFVPPNETAGIQGRFIPLDSRFFSPTEWGANEFYGLFLGSTSRRSSSACLCLEFSTCPLV